MKYTPCNGLIRQFEWVYFDTEESSINEKGIEELKRMQDYLVAHPELKIRIMAHTDSDGKHHSTCRCLKKEPK
ncbi:MAG: OmpA family protein [Flavobacteriales bacterium]|nr:OmpA family protein [Flavobacteriales bacterium]